LRVSAAGSVSSFISSIENPSQNKVFFFFLLYLTSNQNSAPNGQGWLAAISASSSSASSPGPTQTNTVLLNLIDRLTLFIEGRNPSEIWVVGAMVFAPMNMKQSGFAISTKYGLPGLGGTGGASNDSIYSGTNGGWGTE
jgi:hypothetical protein